MSETGLLDDLTADMDITALGRKEKAFETDS